MLYMKTKDYTAEITAPVNINQAVESVSHVNNWWTKSFNDKAAKVGDEFSVRFGETFVKFKITEVIPLQKVVWLVTDCSLHWIENKKNGRILPWYGNSPLRKIHLV